MRNSQSIYMQSITFFRVLCRRWLTLAVDLQQYCKTLQHVHLLRGAIFFLINANSKSIIYIMVIEYFARAEG